MLFSKAITKIVFYKIVNKLKSYCNVTLEFGRNFLFRPTRVVLLNEKKTSWRYYFYMCTYTGWSFYHELEIFMLSKFVVFLSNIMMKLLKLYFTIFSKVYPYTIYIYLKWLLSLNKFHIHFQVITLPYSSNKLFKTLFSQNTRIW